MLDAVFQQRELDLMPLICQARSKFDDGFFSAAAGQVGDHENESHRWQGGCSVNARSTSAKTVST